VQSDEERELGGETASRRQGEFRRPPAQTHPGQTGQSFRIGLPGDQRVEDRSAGHAEDVGGYRR
jgi:hypothetical protein